MTNGEVKIRGMVDDDLPRVHEIDRLLFGEERVPTWPFSFETYWEIYHPKLSFVAEVDGRVVGFLVGNIVQEEHSQSILRLTHLAGRYSRDRQVGWIDMMGILPDYQHRQIGRKLVEAFQQECQHTNAPIRGIVRDNDEKLRNFLIKAGFKKWDIATYEKD
ncbi:MAG: GNAT family N-acetyltransferase [Dehalococcoidales bacterium]|nr:GNAT family N-acetyltransferase [Dehalococcoidales bacterium]